MALGEGVTNALPSLIQHVPEIVISIADCINKSAPKLLTCALQLITQLAWGLIENIPVLVAAIPKIIEAIFKAFTAVNRLNLGSTLGAV